MFQRRTKLNSVEQMRSLFQPRKGYRRPLHYLVWRIKRLPGSPEFIARGFAIGVAINFWPVLFTHLLLGYLFCRLLKGDLLAMFIGTLLGNPATFALVYPVMYRVGKVLMGLKSKPSATRSVQSIEEIWHRIWPVHSWDSLLVSLHEILLPVIIGGFLLGLPCVIFGYYMARNGVRVYQSQRRKRLLSKFEAVEKEIEQMQHAE